MEEVLLRFPHLANNIFEELDCRSMANCSKISRSWMKFLKEEEILTKMRVLQLIGLKPRNSKDISSSLKKINVGD